MGERSMGMPLYEFAECELDTDALELRRDGAKLELGRMPLELLVYLVRNAGRSVGRDELLHRVWRQPHRSRSTVPTTVALLRRALGDDARRPRFIEAVPGRGYRFLPPVSQRGRRPES